MCVFEFARVDFFMFVACIAKKLHFIEFEYVIFSLFVAYAYAYVWLYE